MPIEFEDDIDDEYSEGLDIFRTLAPESTTIAIATSSNASRPVVGRPTIPRLESARVPFAIQRASAAARSPSPMQIDSNTDEMEVENLPIAESSTTRPSTSGTRSLVSARPAKRPSPPVNPAETAPQTTPPSAKRHHTVAATTSTNDQPPAGAEFGTDLEPFIIAHDENVQKLLDTAQLAWGTVYEIARGVTRGYWDWSAVTQDRINQLRGTNAQAAGKVAFVMRGRDVPKFTPGELWSEYDREQEALMENIGRGLGGMGPWKNKDNWYGGRIQQVGRLQKSRTSGDFCILMEKPEIRRSHRFSRFLGSRHLLQIKISKELQYDEVGAQVRRLLTTSKFILCGRVFVPFHAKEDSIYLLETSQDFQRVSNPLDGDDLRISLKEFVYWHNPIKPNQNQPISKWSTRWALGLSTSVPTLQFEPQNIFFIGDEYVSPQDWEGKAPAEKVLTDGCGWINGSALSIIMRMMSYSSRPTAVQGRIGGSKGMWVLHPDPLEQVANGPAKIWIRSSQTKIQLKQPARLGPAQLKFDLLAPSRVTSPSRLNSQVLLNLSHNGVSNNLLRSLMALGLNEEIKPFMDWNQPYSLVAVWRAVERSGSVVTSRLRRMLEGQARAMGLGQLRPKDEQVTEDEDGDEEEPTLVVDDSNHKKSSGQPLSLHESTLELLQSGFHPLKLELLFEKLEKVVTMVLDGYVEKFHIPLTESCEAYIVPDPYGVLEEGQIHFRSSSPFVNPTTGEQKDIILGDVLVSRSPTRLPSDVQKVKAVAHPLLSNYYDVIVFPIKGKQSLASYLGGGDYDGDTVMLIWHQELVQQFRGSAFCPAPPNLFTCFEREVEHVKDFDKRVSDPEKVSSRTAQQTFQSVLLLGLAETKVGLYSIYHDAAVYESGYGSSQAIHLAYMFTTCLDASKTGLRVKEDIFKRDQQTWGSEKKKPWYAWKLEQAKGKNTKGRSNPQASCQRRQNPPCILDVLVEEGESLKSSILTNYRALKPSFSDTGDEDLIKPWLAAKARAAQAKNAGFPGFLENLQDIEVHVNASLEAYKRAAARTKAAESSAHLFDTVASGFAKPPTFHSFQLFSDEDVRVLKASLAALKMSRFAFSVAFNDLCSIKAKAAGNAAITNAFASCMSIPHIVTRAFSQIPGDNA